MSEALDFLAALPGWAVYLLLGAGDVLRSGSGPGHRLGERGFFRVQGLLCGGGFAARIYCSGEDFGGRVWGVFVDDPVPDAGVKVIVPIDDTLAEVIWVAPFARTGQSFFGYLQNEPEHMEGYQVGDSIRFGQDQIADWYLSRDGKVFGNFTTRVMLPHLSEEDRAWLSEMLSDQPIPSDW